MNRSIFKPSRVMSYDNNGNGRASQTPPPPVTSTTSAEVTSTVTCTSSSTVVDTPAPLSRRVRRRLFPEQPVDHAANREFLRSESAKIREQQRQKYNFDFEEGRPINEPSGSYQWEQVTPTVSSLRYSPEKASTSSEKSLPSTTPSFEITPIEIATPSPATSGSSVCTGSTSSIWTTKATTITSKTPQFSLTTTHRSSQPSLLDTFSVVKSATHKQPLKLSSSSKRRLSALESSTATSSSKVKKSKPTTTTTSTSSTVTSSTTSSSTSSSTVVQQQEESSSSS